MLGIEEFLRVVESIVVQACSIAFQYFLEFRGKTRFVLRFGDFFGFKEVHKKINSGPLFSKYSACQTFACQYCFLNGFEIVLSMCPSQTIGCIGICFAKNMGNSKFISSDLDVFGIPTGRLVDALTRDQKN